MLVTREGETPQGHVSAAAFRIIEGGSIALGQLVDGFSRHGDELIATSPTRGQQRDRDATRREPSEAPHRRGSLAGRGIVNGQSTRHALRCP